MSGWPKDIETLASALIADFTAARLTVATAESCTGGLIAGALTEIAGSSAVVDRGFVTYSNRAKVEMLGVDPSTLDAFGAVSRQTALAMVRGALANAQADLAVAVTGIAGPGGGSPDKPVGLVHLAAASRSGRIEHREMRYGDIGRDAVRLATVQTALEMLRDVAEAS
ncbi:CinA family protein [Pararhizobium antarcticum]|uniref:Damage-inducible protein CinA n=1 Tax=Pararhizobium antarcticum TaxID=1798805 RepID=A0A657LK20_9HYPH|nr:CinA family protein [Pararhizobium antarcticum]OJF90026.1 damage-inducible protein CinA [Pararhizobium antarcticum]OJF93142.1 damage-inducible protein CinA [Rhizobium sp. 58]